jgi:DNA-directed RNA polymerase sigma subunit (sigma70/sigma32)
MFWPMFNGDRPLNPEEALIAKEQREQLSLLMDKALTPRMKLILEARYGFRSSEIILQKDLAVEFSVSTPRIGGIEKQALRRMRSRDWRDTRSLLRDMVGWREKKEGWYYDE